MAKKRVKKVVKKVVKKGAKKAVKKAARKAPKKAAKRKAVKKAVRKAPKKTAKKAAPKRVTPPQASGHIAPPVGSQAVTHAVMYTPGSPVAKPDEPGPAGGNDPNSPPQ